MTAGCSASLGRKLRGGLICALILASAACMPGRSRSSSPPGSGGVTESGGVSASGGSVGNGGAGGSSVSDSGGSGAGGAGGAGAGGATVPPSDIPCAADTECQPTGQVCELATKLCVPCVKTADCATDAHCLGNRCVTFRPCATKADCTTDPVCDTTRGVCVECTTDTDCGTGKSCNANKCVARPTCKDNSDCAPRICDTANNVCIDCLVDSHCSTNMHCVRNVCRPACTATRDCAAGMVCDTFNSACVKCLTATDCPASWYCLMNACVPDICDVSQSSCNGTSVAACNATGEAFDGFTACSASKPCTAKGAVATCGGTPVRDGGVSDGPPPRDAGPISSCPGGTVADPCKTGIPKLTGVHTVDGNGSELCSLPYFVLNAQNAVKIINSNSVPTSQLEAAAARVAWDSAGFHAFVEVQDTSVQTANMADASQAVGKAYQGDSVELFIASNANVTGLTSKDTNSLHLIIPANGPAVSVKDTGSSGTSTALPTNQFAQMSTSSGYAIEVSIPWPGGAPTAGGAVRFDLSINSADKSFNGIDKMRDAQLIFYIGTVSGSSTCQTSDGTVPWCDNRTWCQTTVQ